MVETGKNVRFPAGPDRKQERAMTYAATQSSFDSEAVAMRLREELARRRISRKGLAETARLGLSTLEKALSGSRPFTLATVVRLEDALGASLRECEDHEDGPQLAPPEMGSYARPAVNWIEGDYVTLRPSFSGEAAIYAYRTEIRWDSAKGHLVFSESDRIDDCFEQAGFVSMPHLSGHIYLVTSESGQFRTITLGRATRDRRLFGLLATLQVGAGSQLVPVGCPIALVPRQQLPAVRFGLTRQGEADYAPLRTILDCALGEDFCRLRK
jgi:transcriptional regulator with XRE-family HTH domain